MSRSPRLFAGLATGFALAVLAGCGKAPEPPMPKVLPQVILVEADLPPQELDTLVRQPPQAPRSFFEKWADRFADWAVESYSRERLELMSAGGSKGRMLILADFFEFAEENSVELHRDLVALARTDGVSPQAVLLLLQAAATWREGRPDRRRP